MFSPFLRASPGLCPGDRYPYHACRGAGDPHAAGGTISGRRPASSKKISATYTGASAETPENSVTRVIEQQLTGLDNLLYFTSTSSSDGTVSITVTFEQGTDPDTAQVQVQNKVQQAESRLPSEVQQSGVTVEKNRKSSFLLILAVYNKTNRATSSDISDWLVSNMQDPLARVEGVGSLQVFGAEYAMRIWMDPTKLASYSLMPSDVQSAIEAQNVQVSAGKNRRATVVQCPAIDCYRARAVAAANSLTSSKRSL